jgi:twitching motility protein PilI
MSEEQAAFAALQELANKSWRSAQQLPAQIDTRPQWSGVGFSLLGFQFVVPMGQLAEILEVPNFTRLPNVESWVKGVANIRGRLLPILDMGAFLGGRLTGHKKIQRVLVLDTGTFYAGLWVDYVHGMQHFPVDSAFESLPEGLPYSVSAYVSGGFQVGETPWFVFNPIALLEDPNFLGVALD